MNGAQAVFERSAVVGIGPNVLPQTRLADVTCPSWLKSHSPQAKKGAVNFNRQELARTAASLAVQGAFTSAHPPGSIRAGAGCSTTVPRYEYRGEFEETRFKRDCLALRSEGQAPSVLMFTHGKEPIGSLQ